MAGVSVGFAKCFMLFMAVVILAQGVVYLGLAIWGITLKDCQTTTDIAKDPFKFAMDLIYFVDEDCGQPELEFSGYTFELTMDWTKSFAVTNREYIFMIVYAVISGLWIASSCLIILTLCFKTTKLISGMIYWPWFLSVLAGCILDVVATVYHGIDIGETLGLQETFDFIGATVSGMPNEVWTSLETFGVYFSTPAVVMTCISSRVVLIWLLNLIGGMFCLSLANVLANQAAANPAPPPYASQIQPRQQTPQPVLVVREEQLPTAPAESATPSVQLEPQYPDRSRPAPFVIPAETYPVQDRTTVQSPVLVLPPQQQQQTPQTLSPVPENNTYRNTDAHPDQLNYPVADPTSPRLSPTSPAVQQLAHGSTLNSRYSEMYPAPQSNPRVSEELRNQMPWSYTSMITKPPPPPRKPQQQVQIYPQIPEPDYTEH
ncbi:uncharacterized protein LOC133840851 [Drosophila sulfurigaster albostrigata]|uniref:uncharacterized protein LOC133840851 n=1 Tax=Drosophila sulfurigaster albostrigata TaxID=89887 RepID=UPI002D21AA9E|nr:uncharacterized protein LOC133840851 [Drosophila sulfurigaster albostrigata]XP_062128961.1 uncharacterized protein LOC133840851 [Drosophila sulfurigaster albostrigata]